MIELSFDLTQTHMKKLLALSFLCISITSFSQERETIRLGLISRIVKIKAEAEARMSSLLSVSDSKPETNAQMDIKFQEMLERFSKSDTAKISQLNKLKGDPGVPQNWLNKLSTEVSQVQYNKLRLSVDQFILQLIGDMKQKNSLKPYRKIDSYYKTNDAFDGGYPAYALQLQEIDKAFASFTSKQNTKNFKAVGLGTIAELGTLAVGAWTMIKEIKGNKIEGVSEILNELRLKSIKELSEPEEEGSDDEKGKKKK